MAASKLYQTREWAGKWIGAPEMTKDERMAPIFRKQFSVVYDIKSAKVAICGLGLFELKINGVPADDTYLNPVNTYYSETSLYREFDVTHLVHKGTNVITVELGNGFFNESVEAWMWSVAPWRAAPKLMMDLELSYCVGKTETISTDEQWEVTLDGPITENSIYFGETHDMRRHECDYQWKKAVLVKPVKGTVRCQDMDPIRKIGEFKPKSITRLDDGAYVIEAPQMTTGWMKIKLCAPRDTDVMITYGERLLDDGHLHKIGNGVGEGASWFKKDYIQEDHYISDGEEHEFEPKFSYKGYNYIQVENYPGELTEDDITLYLIANDVATVSEFKCSDELVNKLHEMMKRTIVNNLQGKPTDTPVWEKNGWLGDLNVALLSFLYNFDMSNFLPCFVRMMADSQHNCGIITQMVPSVIWQNRNSPVWNTIFVFAVEALYDYYGDMDLLRDMYPDIKTFAWKDIGYLGSRGWYWDDELELADWVAPMMDEFCEGANPFMSEGIEICGTAFAYGMLKSAARLARLLDKEQDAVEYEAAASKIYTVFNDRYYNAEKQIYETKFWEVIGNRTKYRQTSNLVPLYFGLVPEDKKAGVVANLVNDFIEKDYHLDTGSAGTHLVLPFLFDYGYPEVAYKVLMQTTYPSWGYWIENGSTTAWECWEQVTRSKNHYFLATYEEALYSHLVGIRDIRDGFSRFTVAPEVTCGMEWAEGKIQTPGGIAACAWKKGDDKTIVDIEIPFGATAEIRLPEGNAKFKKIVCGGKYHFEIVDGKVIEG